MPTAAAPSPCPRRRRPRPVSARRRRQRFRMPRMTSTSSARCSMSVSLNPPRIRLKPDPTFGHESGTAGSHIRLAQRTPVSLRKRLPPDRAKRALLQKFLFSGQTVRNDRFGRQQQHPGEEQIPPQGLPLLGVFPRQRFRGRQPRPLRRSRGRSPRPRAPPDRAAPGRLRPDRCSRQWPSAGRWSSRWCAPHRCPARSARAAPAYSPAASSAGRTGVTTMRSPRICARQWTRGRRPGRR